MEETYKKLQETSKNTLELLNAVAREYQRAKARYNFGDRHTWDAYVFWRSKYDIIHNDVATATSLFGHKNS